MNKNIEKKRVIYWSHKFNTRFEFSNVYYECIFEKHVLNQNVIKINHVDNSIKNRRSCEHKLINLLLLLFISILFVFFVFLNFILIKIQSFVDLTIYFITKNHSIRNTFAIKINWFNYKINLQSLILFFVIFNYKLNILEQR